MSDTTGEQVQPISDERLAEIEGYLPLWPNTDLAAALIRIAARMRAAEAEVERLRAKVARVEALAEEYARNGAEREAVGAPAWPNNVARDIRAALADEEGDRE